jgi:hypothetical protein
MKTIFLIAVLLVTVLASGCAWFRHKPATARPVAKVETKTIVTPDASLSARVVSVNLVGRFVVLNFPVDQLPKTGQPFFLYRAGLKSAEVKITGPQQDNNIVADLVSGDARVGDIVRDQ